MFVYYNPNPDKKDTSDCIIRALSKVLDQSWEDTYSQVTYAGLILHDMPEKNYVWSKVLKNHGYRRYIIPDRCPDCYSVREFCLDNPKGRYILCLDGHVVAAIDGNYYDTWDSGDGIPLFYWEKR